MNKLDQPMTIEEFCDKHRACGTGREWALANCLTMDDVWARAAPDDIIWVATREGVLSDRDCRLFAVYCARSIEHLLTDQRFRDAIAVAERFADGKATRDELAAARVAAWHASVAALDARVAAGGDLTDDASAAAWYVAHPSAGPSAWSAASAAAAAGAAANVAVRHEQAAWFRANTQPSFKPSRFDT